MWQTWLLDWIKHSALRFISVLAIAAVVIGVPVIVYYSGYNNGDKAGYARCVKAQPPTNTFTGTTTVIQNKCPEPAKVYGLVINHWGFGVVKQ
jgi:hypothetical protein